MKKHFIISIAGFTLAEVLITLTIIGVIAALTIPALIANIQDEQYKTTLKRVYSDLAQTASKLVLDNGGSLKGVCVDGNDTCERNAFINYMSYVKTCPTNTSLGNCWPATYQQLNKTNDTTGNWAPGVILNNGASMMFSWSKSNCDASMGGLYQRCGWIFVDVNGLNPPNTWGRDIYAFSVVENGIKPYGITGDGFGGTCQSWGNGLGCAGVYLRGQSGG